MHTAAKVVLGIGAVFTVIGIIMGIVGGSAVGSLTGPSEQEMIFQDVRQGTFTAEENESWTYNVYAAEEYSCSQVDYISAIDQNEIESFEALWCFEGEEAVGDYLGQIYHYPGDEFVIDSQFNIDIVGEYQYIDEEAIGGIFAIFGAFGSACCGILVLIIGGIMALTMDSGKNPSNPQVGFVQAPVGGMQQSSVVGTVVTGTPNYNQMPQQGMMGQQSGFGQPMQQPQPGVQQPQPGVQPSQPVQQNQGYNMGTVGMAAAVATTPVAVPVAQTFANPQPTEAQAETGTNAFMPPLTDSATNTPTSSAPAENQPTSFWQQPPQGGV